MSDITAMIQDLQKSMIDLQTAHLQIRNKATTGKNSVHSQMVQLEEIESRTSRVENMICRNGSNLNTILETAQRLVKRADSLSVTVDSMSLLKSSDESTNFSPNNRASSCNMSENNNFRSNVSENKNADSKNVIPQTDTQPPANKTHINSVKMNPVTRRTDYGSEVHGPDDKKTERNNSSRVTTKPPTTVVSKSESKTLKSELKTPNSETKTPKSGSKTLKLNHDSGLKSSLTKDDHDNRTSYRTKSKCYQGQLLPSKNRRHVSEKTEIVKPNIVPVQKSQERFPTTPQIKQNELMTMASLAERDFHQKHKVLPLQEWYKMATFAEEKVALNLLLNATKISANGHMYVLLLDVSESMRGQTFDVMIKTAKEYIQGHNEIRSRYGINDNIGLACFGEDTDLLLPAMNDYGGLIAKLDTLRPGGPSPMAAGIVMALAAITRGLGSTKINKHFFKSDIIMLTDGIPTRLEALNEEDSPADNNPLAASSFLTNFQRDKELNAVVSDFARRGFRIHCVPCGSTNNDILSNIAKTTFGRVVPPDQMHRMSRMTMTMFDASEVAQILRYATDVDIDVVRNTLVSNNVQDPYDDITDLVMGILDPRRLYPGYFKKPRWRQTPLGTRIRRGPHWKYKNEDNGLAGTVIGGGVNDESLLWVEWDHGLRSAYVYDENRKIFEIKPVNERRVLVDDLIAVGCKVKRGKDWKHNNQDGGIGSTGTILRVETNGRVFVNWDRGKLATYIFAVDGVFEVEVCNDRGQSTNAALLIEDRAIRTPPMPRKSDDSPRILPIHSGKTVKPATVTWQYQNENGGWTPYGEDISNKIEKAFSRKPNGNCIVEHSGNIYVIHFAQMTQENQSSKSISAVRRLDKTSNEEEEKLIYED